jgi:hypothetical protein
MQLKPTNPPPRKQGMVSGGQGFGDEEMTHKKNLLIFLTLPALVMLVGLACSMPLMQSSTVNASDQIKTAAAQTLQANLTEISRPTSTNDPLQDMPTATATLQPLDTSTSPPPTDAPSSTPAPTQPSATRTSICLQAKFVKDVTVPDNTEFAPGKVFTKTWRLQNSGSCAWNPAFGVVVDGKNTLNAPGSSPVSGKTINPGDTVDISVDLTAPGTVGTYRTNFKLRSDTGEIFGIGNRNNPFWAQINVVVATGLTFDFNNRASQAKWTSGTGNNTEHDLTFGGDVADPNGTATIADGVVLENKTTSGKLLLTIPKRTDNGFIQGVYPAYLVQPGDRIRGRLGFMIPSGSGVCGDGKIVFEIRARTTDSSKKLGEWTTTCDGVLTQINVDLSGQSGQSVQFILIARSVGAFRDNFAIWNSLGVFHE